MPSAWNGMPQGDAAPTRGAAWRGGRGESTSRAQSVSRPPQSGSPPRPDACIPWGSWLSNLALGPAKNGLGNADRALVLPGSHRAGSSRIAGLPRKAGELSSLPHILWNLEPAPFEESKQSRQIVNIREVNFPMYEHGLAGFLGGLLRVEAEVLKVNAAHGDPASVRLLLARLSHSRGSSGAKRLRPIDKFPFSQGRAN